MQAWKKLGLLFSVDKNFPWMYSHASVPFVLNIDGDLIDVVFSSRDHNQVSAICSLTFNIKSLEIHKISVEPLLLKGPLGSFDDSGVMACCTLRKGSDIYLYYIGWNLGVTVPFRNSIGIAESRDNGQTFRRLFPGPLLDRTKDEPHFVASNCVLADEGIYKIWYLSCTGWVRDEKLGQVIHKYHIKYAESHDCINWNREGTVAIDYKDSHEYAISVPRVIRDGATYKMWFSSRGSKNSSTYRIRYAESSDGIRWDRKENDTVLGVSDYGWDSEMVCYPSVFDHNGKRYMLYNGNGYGKSGFGLAVLED